MIATSGASSFTSGISALAAAPISGEDGLRALELALAAYRSVQTHAVVRLPLDGG